MNASGKINGYTEEEAKTLVEYIRKGKKSGKTLTALFAAYGAEHGRARGSVRVRENAERLFGLRAKETLCKA